MKIITIITICVSSLSLFYYTFLVQNFLFTDQRRTLPVSRREIAELIDMRTENVIRVMSEFRQDGLIKINGHVIEIVNPELLQKISEMG